MNLSLSLFSQINYVAVLVAGIIYFALGALWYSPLLFAKPWMAAVGLSDEDVQGGTPLIYLYPFIFYVVAAAVVAVLILALDINTIAEGIFLGVLGWLGFTLPVIGSSYIFESRSFNLFLITNGYHLLGFLLLGTILTLWQ